MQNILFCIRVFLSGTNLLHQQFCIIPAPRKSRVAQAPLQQAVSLFVAHGTPSLSDHLGQERLLALTARIVAAHVAHNRVRGSELPGLILRVH